jgi:16S rRNA (adenine1518-N6/adenine1519-N6)-dimethyltransferase
MELCNINDINSLLSRHGFRFSKSLGQNFLIADWVPERIVSESGIASDCCVLEIGPGIGCLTSRLADVAGKVVSVELDKRLIPVLGETVGDRDNIEIINDDVMKLDLSELVSERFYPLRPVVCANLPYNITSPVLTKLINSGLFETITVMIQKEVAERICAAPGSHDYGAFTIFVNFYMESQKLFDVSPACFEPRPKVTSAVINLKKRSSPAADVNEELFFKIVRAAFNQRRKTLVNGLSSAFSGTLTKDEITDALVSCGLDERVRGESLGIKEFADITNAFDKRI